MRGEFRRGDGLVLPNNVTQRGAEKILSRAFTLQDSLNPTFNPANDPGNYIGLCTGVYMPTMTIANVTEPTVGLNGYQRQNVLRGASGWGLQQQNNGEWYAETLPFTFTPTGPFDQAVSRLFMGGAQATSQMIWALSSPFPQISMDTTTDPSLRTFTYRIYLR